LWIPLKLQHFSLDFLDFPCDTNTMNIVLNALCAFTSCNFSVRLQEAVGRSHANELAKGALRPPSDPV